MARIHELLAQLRATAPGLAADIEREVDVLADRRAFGLNFERHTPEAVELPGRKVRVGDKVRVLPPRGSTPTLANRKLFRVASVDKAGEARIATIRPLPPESGGSRASDMERTAAVDDLVVVAEFRDPIYPGLVSTGKVERGGGSLGHPGDKPYHAVINAENFHALQTLLFTHRGKADAIYIDPPYNTGAKDWKYNNDYVEGDDLYRHSKWLAFLERRLQLAKELLNPDDSVLIVTIDEKEYLRLGLLLEQAFPEATIVMVSAVINRSGVVRANEFTRTNEYIFFVQLGRVTLTPERGSASDAVRWASLRRFEDSSRRLGPSRRPDQFFPIFVRRGTLEIDSIGESIGYDVDRHSVPDRDGYWTIWPLKPDGTEMIWGLTPPSVRSRLASGYVKAVGNGKTPPTLYYLTSGQIGDINSGEIVVSGRTPEGAVQVEFTRGRGSLPSTQWDRDSHQSKVGGTGLLAALIPGRRFPFPKSLFAVEDALRYVVASKPNATVVDFFSGSGTTAHAVMRLNKQDGGRRVSISVTNNEVSADEQARLRKEHLRPGDVGWEKFGICNFITNPRIRAAVEGKTPDGEPIKGEYKFTDTFLLAEGLEENVEFFTLTYEAPIRVQANREFARIAPFLWLRASSRGRRIESLEEGWEVADSYGVLSDLDQAKAFVESMAAVPGAKIAFIVTDEDRLFEAVVRELPEGIEPVRLYEAYLRNFEIDAMRSVR